jgi:hypothetical protein
MSEAKPFERRCPRCGEAWVEGQRHCLNCGHDLYAMDEGRIEGRKETAWEKGPTASKARRSVRLTIILAIIFPGLGHLYAGRLERGIIIMAVFILILAAAISTVALLGSSVVGLLCVPLIVIVGIGLFIFFEIWQILDAMNCAAAANSV